MGLTFSTPITDLPGIGTKRAQNFSKLGITNVEELLYHFPKAYRNKGNVKKITECEDGDVCSLILTVSCMPKTAMLKGRMTLTKFRAFDESGSLTVAYFNQRYLEKLFTVGAMFRFYGKISKKSGNYSLSSPDYEPVFHGKKLPDYVPMYKLCEGINQKTMRSTIDYALNELNAQSAADVIPERIRDEMKLQGIVTALRHIHFPQESYDSEQARKRFAFEEFFAFSLGTLSSSKGKQKNTAPIMADVDVNEFYKSLPFEPTDAQIRTINEIKADLTNKDGYQMSRLVSGDVGSGKTLCAVLAAYIVIKSGYQAALMAPTEILVHQHYADISVMLAPFNIVCACLTSSTKAKERRLILDGLQNGSIDFVIGTHSLLSQNVVFSSPGLVITDEQHRFGVSQRAQLSSKSAGIHTLVMSATPIPRTLALILYGDLDISAVDRMPPGRQRVDTYAVDESYRERLNNFIRKQASEGSQTYIVCPSIEAEAKSDDEQFDNEKLVDLLGNSFEAEQSKLKSAVEYAKELQDDVFPDLKIGLIHGKLKPEQKDKVMEEFAEGKINVLVSTTVIEVGVNVPNATLMIVENAERFGLSALHQLRGRVGRGKKKSYCILVSDTDSEPARERIKTMCNNYNGYDIAQKDLEMRGPGDLLPSASGTARQSGDASFRFASVCSNMDLLKSAFDYANQYTSTEQGLEAPELAPIKERINRTFSLVENTIN